MTLHHMFGRWIVSLVALIGSVSVATAAATPAVSTLNPTQYQSFVQNWKPADAPLCAAITSADQWNRIFHPAPVMGGNLPFAPPASFWAHNAVLIVARVINAGNTANVFRLNSVLRTNGSLDVRYAFRPTPAASSTMKWWLGAVVAKPLPPTVRYRENARLICTLNLARHHWASPAPR